MTRNVKFARREEAFVDEVRTRVAAWFDDAARSRKADARMVRKTVAILALTVGSYALLLTGILPGPAMLALCVLLGLGLAGIGFSIAHDALHGAYCHSARGNRWLGYTFDFIGANGYMWKITHNVIHHTYTNIHGVDEDLTVSPLLRLSPGAPLHWYHRFQGLYGFAAYGLATLNWLFVKDYQQFLKKDLGPYRNRKHPRREIVHLVWTKLVVYGWMIVLPLVVMDVTWWQFLIGFVVVHLTAGTVLGVVFQLAHVVEGPAYPVPDAGGRIDNAWLIHEMETTADFAHGNRLLSWYIGGLNYQIEHHLFPQVCSVHYPLLAGIVRRAAEEYGVPYHYHRTLRAAVASHYRMLRSLGRSDGSPGGYTPAPAVSP